MAYFWLGYGHARGKNVVPITVIKQPKDPVDDLAFDIRAQRHMTFVEGAPDLLERELEETLRQMVNADFSEWSRKRFWDEMLGRRGEVSIFIGALHSEAFNREMIGDWDLRTVSELTSFFARHQYRAKIETPIYAPERATGENKSDKSQYIKQLAKMMEGKNCILVASPDVNALTEIVLGKIYGVPEEQLFDDPVKVADYPQAIVALKEKGIPPEQKGKQAQDPGAARRAFYTETASSSATTRRGFTCSQIKGGKILHEFVSQTDAQTDFSVYAHLAIVPNPFSPDPLHPRYIIVLNGVSGPATFALTHVLTGGVSGEFVAYEQGFNPEAESEGILKRILDELQGGRRFRAMECIISVKSGADHDPGKKAVGDTFDWRRIRRWQIEENALGRAIRVLT
jgi:hypothetical protein